MSLRKRIKSNLKVPAALVVTLCLSALSLVYLNLSTATALEFQTDTSGDNAVKLDFTFGETLNITTSDNTVAIPELTPGHSGVSASNYTVTVNTNAQAGYTLSATVGCSSSDTNYNTSCYDSTSLSDGTNTFDMIAADGTLSAGEWGIALVNTETVSSFKTLAKWDGTATVLNQTVDASGTAASGYAGNSATPFRIGAAATNSQEAGTYQNRINFIAVANVACQSTISGTMQDFDPTNLCDDATGSLTDSRGGTTKSYTVAKLADGKCWMIENMRLNDSVILSSSNTHNPSLPLTNSWYYTDSQTTPTTSNHLSATTDPTTTAWCTTDSSACDDQSMLATNNTTLFTNNTASSYNADGDVYSYGNYYNWYSATGGHGKYGSSYDSSYTAPGDICPAGWHLPTGKGATGDFGVLDIALGGTGASQSGDAGKAMSLIYRSYPNNFVYSGYVNGSSVYNRNFLGIYWSSSAYSSSYAYDLYFHGSSVNAGAGTNSKYYGGMARCVAGVQQKMMRICCPEEKREGKPMKGAND